jgi:hypothetical protein
MSRIDPSNASQAPSHVTYEGETIHGRTVTGTAVFSPCKTWRYRLTRSWNEGRGACLWIMLNPSTADASRVDPTVRRAMSFAMDWGFQHGWVANVFAIRATDPDHLYRHPDPIGPDNDRTLQDMASQADRVMLAWGNHALHGDRFQAVLGMIAPWKAKTMHVGLNKSGMPKHPLYVRGDITPLCATSLFRK